MDTKKMIEGRRTERGAVLLEMAMTMPLLLLLTVSIFEFGRAYQTWQVVTNTAREGARMAVLPGADSGDIEARMRGYLQSGQLSAYSSAQIVVAPSTIVAGGATVSTSVVTVNYPFSFLFLNPIARLIVNNSSLGGAAMTISASAEMRNESPF